DAIIQKNSRRARLVYHRTAICPGGIFSVYYGILFFGPRYFTRPEFNLRCCCFYFYRLPDYEHLYHGNYGHYVFCFPQFYNRCGANAYILLF
ncbi:MAG: hypothetical protein AVDCRST_MAG95-3665, partial [uncultured Adhaeribacter sp.]